MISYAGLSRASAYSETDLRGVVVKTVLALKPLRLHRIPQPRTALAEHHQPLKVPQIDVGMADGVGDPIRERLHVQHCLNQEAFVRKGPTRKSPPKARRARRRGGRRGGAEAPRRDGRIARRPHRPNTFTRLRGFGGPRRSLAHCRSPLAHCRSPLAH